MSEALLLSVIQKLENYRKHNPPSNEDNTDEDEAYEDEDETYEDEADEDEDDTYEDEDETYEELETNKDMERVIEEMREIVDIVRDKKLEDGRSLNFLVSDLVDMADDAIDLFKQDESYSQNFNSIHSWIGEIKTHMLKLGDDDESNNMISSENVEDDKYPLVGLDEDVEILVRKMIVGTIALIKGMSGIGKTTLAREIYNHPTIIKNFKHRAWVSNSTYFTTVKELLIKLIQQLEDPQTSSSLENMDNPSLRDMLSQHLQGKRYLIVLDDMPKQMRFKSFLEAFQQERNGTRLLLTSHTTHVDLDPENVYNMNPLDPKKSWQLFLKTINHGNKLTGDHKFPMSLEYIGKQMLRKCGGLPLAIKEVGKQLAEKKVSGQSEWEQLLQSVDFGSTLMLLNMSEALLISVIQRLKNYRKHNPLLNWDLKRDAAKEMDRVIKETREIVDIVRDKKLEEGRSLNFLVSDLVDVADHTIFLLEEPSPVSWEFDSIHSWMGEIKKQMLKLGDDESNIRSSENVDDNFVVGLDKDLEILLCKWIIGGDKDESTVLIKGIPGIGKTTLAREIYNHPTVVEQFQCRAWVSNSTDYFTMNELLIKLIQQVVVEDPQNLHTSALLENMDNQSLRDMLSQHLQGKRYLIVLDDIPKQMCFKFFKNALLYECNGSRLMLTSHTTHADISVPYRNVYKMEALDSKKSWQLFLRTINHGNKLMDEHKFPMNLEDMAKDMLTKCGGLPLAIKEVGKQLMEKKLSRGKWEQLLESVDFGPILKLLEPFYLQLDPKLDSCFLSMAFFKENTNLRKAKLIHIWVAGEIVEYAYDGESYLKGLINESVIDVNYKGTKYRMNVVLHMLSIQKAEEKFGLDILRNNGNYQASESPRHHRVIICSRDKFNHSTDQDKHLVSLFFQGGGYLDTSPSYWKSFEQLKILDLEDFGLKFLPETIGTLMELRYLGLRNNYLQELPDSLGCMKKLEVLDIAQNFMVEVPDIIWKLYSLLHLYMSNLICRKPLKIYALRNLETLTYVSVDNWTYELSGLKGLECLKKLGIEELDGNSVVSKLFVSLAMLESLKYLILRGYRFRSIPCLDELGILHGLKALKLDGLLARLPTNFPPNIESLTLVNSCLDKDPMPLLALMLPELKYLTLRNAFTGQQMVILDRDFHKLRFLRIEELWNLRNVRVGRSALGDLNILEINDCPYLDTLPEEIVSLSSLKEFIMVTTKSIATKMRSSDLISNLISKIEIVNINP